LAPAIVIGAGVARLIIAALTPLFPDETYYWEWSRHLAAGYFDHPPVIAWLIRIGTMIAGNTPLGVRLGPVLAGTLGVWFVCLATRRMADDRAAALCAVIFAVMPLSAAGLILATPDAPLLAAIAASTYAVVRALEHQPGTRDSLAWWSWAGLALGIGLASKYTAVLVAVGVFLALATHSGLRRRLREPGPYVATLLAILVFLPVMAWNAAHDWVSFAFQLRHGLGGAAGSALNRELELIAGQLGLVSPILFGMIAVAVTAGARRDATQIQRVLAVAAMFVFAFFVYSATRRRVEANWPAIAYVPGVLLLVARSATQRWERWMRAGIALSFVMMLVTYVNAFTPILPVPARRDPAARAHGWEDLARVVDRIHAPRRPISSYRTWIAADRYQDASELAFHLPDNPETFALNLVTRPNNYDLWPSFTDRAHPRDGLILVVDDISGVHPTVALLEPHFERVQKADSARLSRKGDVTRHLRLWILDGWRGTWPTPEVRSR
jgi:4-amino-4-deoxy-L-arabinose transferase-like glycosyltransferase